MAPQKYSDGFIPAWTPAGLCHPKLYLHLYTGSNSVIPHLKRNFDFWSCWRIIFFRSMNSKIFMKLWWLENSCGIEIEDNRGKKITAEMVYNINCELPLLPGTGWVRLHSPPKLHGVRFSKCSRKAKLKKPQKNAWAARNARCMTNLQGRADWSLDEISTLL